MPVTQIGAFTLDTGMLTCFLVSPMIGTRVPQRQEALQDEISLKEFKKEELEEVLEHLEEAAIPV